MTRQRKTTILSFSQVETAVALLAATALVALCFRILPGIPLHLYRGDIGLFAASCLLCAAYISGAMVLGIPDFRQQALQLRARNRKGCLVPFASAVLLALMALPLPVSSASTSYAFLALTPLYLWLFVWPGRAYAPYMATDRKKPNETDSGGRD